MTSELELIAQLSSMLPRAAGDLLIASGDDDSAAWREPGGSVTVASCDAMVDGVHFDLAWLAPEDVGWRAVALALGDLAAKGATPTYGLVTLAIPRGALAAAAALYRGMAAAARRFGLELVGGDTVRSAVTSISITVLGRATNPVLPRSAAQPGWEIAVTGRLGAARAGLLAAMGGAPLPESWEAALRRPVPRLREGRAIAAAGAVSGDISDGLLREMEKFRAAAGVGAEIEVDAVPVAAGVDIDTAMVSGEEVELVCTGPPEVIARAREVAGVALTVVGRLTAGGGLALIGPGGRRRPFPAHTGHDHFS